MPHYFFFSYARGSYDNFLQKFFEDLSDRVRQLLGLGQGAEVGFIDLRDLELGAQWDDALVEALQSTRVMVSIYSPAYFNSEFCGKEWAFFRRRAELFAERARAQGAANAAAPPIIKPVIWLPQRPGRNPPEPVNQLQYYWGDPQAPHNKVGLQEMRRLRARYRQAYDAFINQLAGEVLNVYDMFEQGPGLPRLDPVPELSEVPSAFHQPAAPLPAGAAPPPPPPARRRGGPKYVRFVFIAGDPAQFPDGARAREFYLEYGGGEWKPYYPDVTHPIMSLANAEAGMLGMLSDELPFDPNLDAHVRAAEDARSLVVMFVDGWTAELLPYRQALEKLDRNSYINCSIFVPWNVKDPQTAGRAEDLKRLLRSDIFPRWSRLADASEPVFFRDAIYSVEDLREQLRDTLRRLQVMMMKGVVEQSRPEDLPRRLQSEMSKPVLSHGAAPGAGGAP